MSDKKRTFEGPLFVVGMSRSGTSLLRNVLNRSPAVGIPYAESIFFPYIIKRFGNKTFPLGNKEAKALKGVLNKSRFIDTMRSQGISLPDDELDKILKAGSLAEILENIIRYFVPHTTRESGYIWGDKSPVYMLNIDLLKKIFPTARFIHIIRDPRERSLSAHKAWSANLYVAAERWHHYIQSARQQGFQLGADYLEVFYEQFTKTPANEIKRICNFLTINYDESMLELNRPTEKLAGMDAVTRHTTRIVPDNTNKYLQELSHEQIKRIDEIVFPLAPLLGYSPTNSNTVHVPLKGMERMVCYMDNLVNVPLSYLRYWGMARGIKNIFWRLRMATVYKLSTSDY